MKKIVLGLLVACLAPSTVRASSPKPRCTYSINPTQVTVGAAGASGTVAVTAPNGCSWKAVSNASFVAVASGASGNGSGTVSYRVAANTATTSRAGTLTVAKQTFTVNQDGQAPPPPPPPSNTLDLPARPTGGRLITVPAGGDLQAAIDAAAPNDVIALEPGATYAGNFVLRAKGGSGYIMIRTGTSDAGLPPEGTRVSPADAAAFARVRSPNNMPAIATAPGATYYRLQYLEVLPNAVGTGDMITLGDGSSQQNSLSQVPHDLVIDQCYIHGAPGVEQRRGVALNSGLTWIANSDIEEIKSAGSDSQAICGWNGPGPFRIYNNYLSAAGENFMLGGSDPSIVNLVPTDVVFRYNYVTKPTAWRGSSWQVKNLFELKNAQQVTVDQNVFEYNWLAAQAGYSILFTPRNQYGGAPWTVVQNVTFSNNRVRHVSSVFNILGTDNLAPSLQTNGIQIVNNVFEDVSAANWGGAGRFMLITGAALVTIDHNTVFEDGGSFLYAYGTPSTGFVFRNTIVPDNAYGIFGDNSSPGNASIATYFPAGAFPRNLIVHCPSPWAYPADSYYPATWDAVGFVPGTYTLSGTSAYVGAATDGTNPGADMSKIPQ